MNYISRDEIAIISASSGGIFTAYALAANKLEHIEHLYRSIDIPKKRQLFWEVFAHGLISDYIDAITGVNDNLDIPVCFPITYIPLFSVRYYWIYGNYNRTWKRYMTGATNYPFLKIVPSIIGGRIAIDGGAADNIPLYPLLKKAEAMPESEKPDLIFVLHFDTRYDFRQVFETDIPVLDLDLSFCNDFSKHHYDFSAKAIDTRIKKSYEYGDAIAKRLFSGDCTKEHFIKTINEIFVEEHTLRQQTISIDRLVTYLNVVGKALRNDARCMFDLF